MICISYIHRMIVFLCHPGVICNSGSFLTSFQITSFQIILLAHHVRHQTTFHQGNRPPKSQSSAGHVEYTVRYHSFIKYENDDLTPCTGIRIESRRVTPRPASGATENPSSPEPKPSLPFSKRNGNGNATTVSARSSLPSPTTASPSSSGMNTKTQRMACGGSAATALKTGLLTGSPAR